MMEDHVHIDNVDLLPYHLYTGQTYYRYKYHFNLLVEGVVDSRDVIRLRDNLQAGIFQFPNNCK